MRSRQILILVRFELRLMVKMIFMKIKSIMHMAARGKSPRTKFVYLKRDPPVAYIHLKYKLWITHSLSWQAIAVDGDIRVGNVLSIKIHFNNP